MMENYYYDLCAFYLKIFLMITFFTGVPLIMLLLLYRFEVNKCIIDQVNKNITINEAVNKNCNSFRYVIILFVFLHVFMWMSSIALDETKELKTKPVKPDNSTLEIEIDTI